jgi:hypothetical protein
VEVIKLKAHSDPPTKHLIQADTLWFQDLSKHSQFHSPCDIPHD